MPTRRIYFLLLLSTAFASYSIGQERMTPQQKLPATALKEDLSVLQNILEAFHPSLYAYLSKEEWESACRSFQSGIGDSLTVHQFLYGSILPLLAQIRCGHTNATYPRQLSKYWRSHPPGSFPLLLKCWPDTMMVLSHLSNGDSRVPRGSFVTSIDGMPTHSVLENMIRFIPTDGYADTYRYHRISASFPSLHRNVFGLRKEYRVGLRMPGGLDTTLTLYPFRPALDSQGDRKNQVSASDKRRPFQYSRDSLTGAAVLRIETFDKRFGVRRFYRRSFRDIDQAGLQDLILDIRNNGGGYVDQEVQLARYLKRSPFRVADTAAAVAGRLGKYRKFFHHYLTHGLALSLLTRRQPDGKYHLHYWERRVYQPHRKFAYRGRTHIIISGPTFSAASLFAALMKGEENVFLLGEETGGGAYANNGLLLPECSLPNSRIRLTIPLFRIVADAKAAPTGRGLLPDITVGPDPAAIRLGVDKKMEEARKRILENPMPKRTVFNRW